MYYAEGGMARQADNLASRGRGGDTMLVHMNPKEVGGLAALAQYGGDPMTINPDTGLPEAKSSFLKQILPTIVGFALGPAGIGLSALQAGLVSGGLRVAMGGNLREGLMAGLGAYGGANLGASFQAMGTPVDPTSGLKANSGGLGLKFDQAALDTSKGTLATADYLTPPADYSLGAQTGNPFVGVQSTGKNVFGLQNLGAQSGTGIQGMQAQANNIFQGGSSGLETVGSNADLYSFNPADSTGFKSMGYEFGTQGPRGVVETVDYSFNSPNAQDLINRNIDPNPELGGRLAENYKAPGNLIPKVGTSTYSVATPPSALSQGVRNTFSDVEGLKKFGSTFVDESGGKIGALAGAYGMAAPFYEQEPMEVAQPEQREKGIYVPEERTYTQPSTAEILAGGGREFQYFDPSNPAPGYRFMPTAAKGGLLALNKMAGGRYLQGAGDGTSDSIPATIGQNQPARLADGEFVVDARTVSELGNGSSDAGARKLYAMMDNVHNARRNAERGKPSGADKYLNGLTAAA